MIVDELCNIEQYASLHKDFPKVFRIIKEMDFLSVSSGRINFESETFYVNVDDACMRGENDAVLEAHDRYIDIQVPISCSERYGYASRRRCVDIKTCDELSDLTFYNDRPEFFADVRVGSFAIFFPADAHAPLVGEGTVRKIVFKVRVS